MPQPAPTSLPPSAPAAGEIPDSFFGDISVGVSAARDLVANLGHPVPQGVWQPQKVLPWYDAIIDDMFAHPGCTMKETAARLARSPVTIGLIVRSDLFKTRYAQRRAAYNDEIQHRLTGKLVAVAEAALDHTLTALDKKKDSVPLPLLNEITNRALDRLGYGPSAQPANPAVQVNVNTGDTSVQVGAEALAAARDKLRIVEGRNAAGPRSAPALAPAQVEDLRDEEDRRPGAGVLIEGSSLGAL